MSNYFSIAIKTIALLMFTFLVSNSVFADKPGKAQKGSFPKMSGVQHGHGANSPGTASRINQGHSRARSSSPNFSHGGHSSHSNHSAHRPNYDSHSYHQPSGHTHLSINRGGVGLSYSNGSLGINVGTSRYYRPTLGYGSSSPLGYGSGYGSTNYGYGYSYSPSRYDYPYGDDYRSTIGTPYSSADLLAIQQLRAEADAQRELRRKDPASEFPVIRTSAAALDSQRRAESAFRDGMYAHAAQIVQQAITLDNRNGYLYLFSSQCQFALGNFEQAVDDLQTATQLLASDQWNYVAKNYRSFYGKNDYVAQTDRLTQQIERNPNDHAALTLRGYHYGSLGYPDAAASDFESALAIRPTGVAAQLSHVLGKPQLPATIPPDIQQPVPTGVAPSPNQLPAPGGYEEIAPDNIIRLVPQANLDSNKAPILTGPSN